MVSIVIVSHSNKIAEGIVELCGQMAEEVPIIPAGGTEDNRIGTDALKIKEAIERADDGDGVVVFVDLGSALMNAEMALELLNEDLKDRVIIVDSPIVEGSVVASVEASLNKGLEDVVKSAEEVKSMNKKG